MTTQELSELKSKINADIRELIWEAKKHGVEVSMIETEEKQHFTNSGSIGLYEHQEMVITLRRTEVL